jgi:hypothetical protein
MMYFAALMLLTALHDPLYFRRAPFSETPQLRRVADGWLERLGPFIARLDVVAMYDAGDVKRALRVASVPRRFWRSFLKALLHARATSRLVLEHGSLHALWLFDWQHPYLTKSGHKMSQ